MKAIVSIISFLIFISCNSDSDNVEIPIFNFQITEIDAAKELSHTPTGKVDIEFNDSKITIDFGYDDTMTDNIEEYGELLMDTVHTFGQLLIVYENQKSVFSLGHESYFNPYTDGNYVFPKLEYILAQECFDYNCSIQTRKAVLQAAIDKQNLKYEDFQISSGARRTGLFLMAVILVRNNYVPFIEEIFINNDIKNTLCLNKDIPIDKDFRDTMISFAVKYLSDN